MFNMNKTYLICEKSNPSIVKIGVSYDVEKRLSTLKSQTRKDLEIVSFIDMDIEMYAHQKFASLSIGGEWFMDDGSIRSFFENTSHIKSLSNYDMNNDGDVDDREMSPILIVDGMISITKIISKINKPRKRKFNLSQWLKTKRVQTKIKKLESLTGKNQIVIGRGRNSSTLISKELFLSLAGDVGLSVDIDELNLSVGDTLKTDSATCEMIGRLYLNTSNKTDWNSEIDAILGLLKSVPSEKIESVRSSISQLSIIMDNDEAVRLALEKNK